MSIAKKPEPLYVMDEDGSLDRISPVIGTGKEKPITEGDRLVASLNPDLVITRAEYEKYIREFVRSNFEYYRPTIEALNKLGSSTPEKVSVASGVPVGETKKYLDGFYGAGLIGKHGEIYTMTDENMKEIMRLFGVA